MADHGASGSATKIRERESGGERASQPIVSEFVYDDSALSKKFLWLTSTSSARNTKVNPSLSLALSFLLLSPPVSSTFMARG